ncbi:cupin domain-containing protein [Desulfovibrio ferrophilus]|uniref:Cupin 2 conserved barrel domain protein n=1 Tax=Desulfovibrio ferrophilus TaxID=241368 RepID=A0A2Z6B0E1_9BACT|nr:cupin domain-containing protein [Desulfovibrio ferrophilus]BBD08915.1 cupin 2 conserved barrel domain protein [Desulfovibrio ferrophilus]
MSENQRHDDDVARVLKDDGVEKTVLKTFENVPVTNLAAIKDEMGEGSWAVRLVYNDVFGGVLIQQLPGEGNRLHFHPDAHECWVIMEGEWEWFIDGEGTRRVVTGDIVTVPQGVKHKIRCVGDKSAIRFAITRPDVNHVYAE